MNSKGMTILETLLAMIIIGLTSMVVIGIITINKKILLKPTYYKKYMEEMLRIDSCIRPLGRNCANGFKANLFKNGDNWIINYDNEAFLEYQNNTLHNYFTNKTYSIKYSKIKIKFSGKYIVFVLEDGRINYKLYARWNE